MSTGKSKFLEKIFGTSGTSICPHLAPSKHSIVV